MSGSVESAIPFVASKLVFGDISFFVGYVLAEGIIVVLLDYKENLTNS